jgi:hypothetical protein
LELLLLLKKLSSATIILFKGNYSVFPITFN